MQENLINLFLKQYLDDGKTIFNNSLKNSNETSWDAIIITASNLQQAQGYEEQLAYRRSLGMLPKDTDFIVVPDKDNKRVGSGGSTLSVIKLLKEKYGDFSNKKFLCIHAGGDSKRCPQYSAIGKLFSPVPTLINNKPACLFDMFMITMAGIPSRLSEGLLCLSGDVILLFNYLMCDFGSLDAAVISFKEDINTANNHGVYLSDENGIVKKFLHKQSIETLHSLGASDDKNMCHIDTGAIELGKNVLNSLYKLVDTKEKYDSFVNEKVRLSLYGDIAYCLASESNLNDFYQEKPEGEFCEELKIARTKLWNAIGKYNMKMLNLAPAKFIHFGSIPEICKLMSSGYKNYETLGWSNHVSSSINRDDIAAYNSILSREATIGENSYLESSYVHGKANIGKNCYISFLDIEDQTIPSDLLLHGLKLKNGKFVCRIIGINDNPKGDLIFNIKISDFINKYSLDINEICSDGTLWNACIYPECDSIYESINESLNLYKLIIGEDGDLTRWKKYIKHSLCSSFNKANPKSIIDWNNRMQDLVIMDELDKAIKLGKSILEAKNILSANKLSKIQLEWVDKAIGKLNLNKQEDFSYAIRLYYYLGICLDSSEYISKCFKQISSTILSSTLEDLSYNEKCKISFNETIVKLPLRINFGGGWSDTPPHCLENGGNVLNAAISLNGELPVEVRLVKIKERRIVFDSRDMNVHGEFTSIESLQDTGDPFDPFALQKACLLACGVIPKDGGNLEDILNRLGGGFEMHSEVTNVPKGSGLGTSSILSAACVKAMLEFMGINYDEHTLYSTVLAMEQIMSTGGGWQDQVGGVVNGIKLVSADKGIKQDIKVEHLNLSEKTKKELNERLCLIYTGQRRLARNLLRDVIGRYLGNVEESLFAHKEIQIVADKMKDALLHDNVDEFAKLLDYHWKLSQMIDAGSTNVLIDQIFASIDDLIDARMVVGAGGGGFLQVILKNGVSKNDVHIRLKEVFMDFAVDVYDSEIVY